MIFQSIPQLKRTRALDISPHRCADKQQRPQQRHKAGRHKLVISRRQPENVKPLGISLPQPLRTGQTTQPEMPQICQRLFIETIKHHMGKAQKNHRRQDKTDHHQQNDNRQQHKTSEKRTLGFQIKFFSHCRLIS